LAFVGAVETSGLRLRVHVYTTSASI